MTTRLSPDDIQNAIEALKPDADTLGNAWYIGLRENTLQSVLARAKARHDPPGKAEASTQDGADRDTRGGDARRWYGVGLFELHFLVHRRCA